MSDAFSRRKLLFFSLLLFSLADVGCDKLPKPEELVTPETPAEPATPPEAASTPEPMETVPDPKTPEQILEEFHALKPSEIEDRHLEEIGKLELAQQSIEQLDVSSSQVTDKGIEFLRDFHQLKSLNLSQSRVQGTGLQALSKLEQLEELQIDNVLFDRGSRDALKAFAALRVLSMKNVGLADTAYEVLAELPHLEVLHIDGNKNLIGRYFADLVADKKFANLKELTANNTDFGHYGLLSIDQLEGLEVLRISSAGLNLKSMVPLSKCDHLKVLDLSDNPLSNEALVPLKRLKNLEELYLSKCTGLSDPAATTLKTMRKLQRLELKETSLTPKAQESLTKALKETEIIFE